MNSKPITSADITELEEEKANAELGAPGHASHPPPSNRATSG